MSITKIDKTCVVKHQILIGDQLIGVNDDYFRDCAYSFRDVIQLIKNKQSNPVRILTFQRYKKDEIWYIVRVIPAAEEQILCRIKECSKDAAVSWAFNLNPEDIWDLCEGWQVIKRGDWPEGVHPFKYSADSSNDGSNTQIDYNIEVNFSKSYNVYTNQVLHSYRWV